MPALLVLLLSACNENLIDTNHPEGEGKVSISLSADERVEIVSARSGAENSLPRPEDFRIEIVNSENVKLLSISISETRSCVQFWKLLLKTTDICLTATLNLPIVILTVC